MNTLPPFSPPQTGVPSSAGSESTRGEIKKTRASGAIRKKKIKQLIWALGIIAVIAGGIFAAVRYARTQAVAVPGEIYIDAGQEHVALNAEAAYNSNPPSSGPHYGSPANWGIYDYEVNDKLFIHNLEHGGVWISYRPDVSADVVTQLRAIVDEYGGSKFVMAPRSANDTDIAVAAWTRVYKFNLSGTSLTDEEKKHIRAFYRGRKNRGPEFVPDTMPGVDPKSAK